MKSKLSLYVGLVIIASFLAACSTRPPDANTTDAGSDVQVSFLPGCIPAADTPPKLVSGRTPIYPASLVITERDGHAIIAFDVDSDGTTRNLQEIDSSKPQFYNHTHNAVMGWRFEPAQLDGKAITVRCQLRQGFRVPFKRGLRK